MWEELRDNLSSTYLKYHTASETEIYCLVAEYPTVFMYDKEPVMGYADRIAAMEMEWVSMGHKIEDMDKIWFFYVTCLIVSLICET